MSERKFLVFRDKHCEKSSNVRLLTLSSSFDLIAFLDEIFSPRLKLPGPGTFSAKCILGSLVCVAFGRADRARHCSINARFSPSCWESEMLVALAVDNFP